MSGENTSAAKAAGPGCHAWVTGTFGWPGGDSHVGCGGTATDTCSGAHWSLVVLTHFLTAPFSPLTWEVGRLLLVSSS